MGKILAFSIIGLIFLVILIGGPWLAMWSVGVLFNYHIPFTFDTWAAAIFLLGLLNGSGARRK